jgi:glycosyltransferase involved in cell wall biosynthesis
VIIPAVDEARNLEALVPLIHDVMANVASVEDYEILVVDDGSTDDTPAVLQRLQMYDARLTAIILRRNFGKSAALMAGFDQASGDVIVTMDGDLQDDPAEIPRMIAELQRGYDAVSGWKQHREDRLEKRVASRVFNVLASAVTGVRLKDVNCGFKAYRRWCLEDIQLTGNLYRFLPVFVHRKGGRIAEIAVHHQRRAHGRSKFGYRRYFAGAADLITILLLGKFFQRPLYFFAPIGAALMALGSAVGVYLLGSDIYSFFTGDPQHQLTAGSLVAAITLFGAGLQILLIGLLAELMVSRTSVGSTYAVREMRAPQVHGLYRGDGAGPVRDRPGER